MHDDEHRSGVELTLISNANNQPLSKSYSLKDGKIEKTPAANMFAGTAERRLLKPGNEAHGLLGLLDGMPAHQAITLGRVIGGTGTLNAVFQITTASRLHDAPPGTIARTRSFFEFPRGPGFALADLDLKGAPNEVLTRLQDFGLRGLMIILYPAMANVASISRGSLSSAVHVEGAPTRRAGAGGEHLFVLLDDVSRTPEFLEALHRLAWANGLGWIMVDKAGRLHARSIVDVSVGQSERLVFEGDPASLGPGLALDPAARCPIKHEGEALDVARFLAHVDELAPKASHTAAVNAAKQELREEAATVRTAYEAGQEAILISRGATRQSARSTVRLRRNRCLSSDDIMFDESGKQVGVAEVVLALVAWDGRPVPDPIEGPDYGMTTAQVVARDRDDGLPGIFTYAHGGGCYRLRWSAAGIRTLMERRGEALTADELIEAFRASVDVGTDDLGSILQGAGVLLDKKHPSYFKGGMPALKAACKRALPAGFPNEPDDEEDGEADNQVVVRLEGPDEAADARRVHEVLRTMLVPRVFGRGGDPVSVVEERARNQDGDGFTRRLAIRIGDSDGARREMLGFVRFMVRTREGMQPGTAKPAILATWAEGTERLPPLVGLTSFPPISADGELSFTPGYDAASGFYYDGSLGAEVADRVPPDPGLAEAREAWGWLQKEVFGDFPFSDPAEGPAALLAFLVTACTRSQYPTAPGFAVSARQARTGKGKLINVVCMIATGSPAPSTSLSSGGGALRDDETGKTITGLLLQGQEFIHLDNLEHPLGGSSIDILLTTPEWQKRVVGLQSTPRLSARVTVCASGNNLAVVKDTVARMMLIDMDARHEAPEKRNNWRHPHLEQWVRDHRAEIAARVITIVMAYRRLGRPNDGAVTLGNFEAWTREVADLVQWLTGVDPTVTQLRLRRDDPEQSADRELLASWYGAVGSRPLQLRSVMDETQRFDEEPAEDDAIGPEVVSQSQHRAVRRAIQDRWGANKTTQGYGNMLAKLSGARIGGFMLERLAADRNGVRAWRVVVVGAEAGSAS